MLRLWLLALALAPSCLCLRQRGAGPPEQDFFACEEEGRAVVRDCSPVEGVPPRQMDELLEAGYRRMRAVAAAGRTPLALHIGADDLGNEARWTDVHLYTRVLRGAALPPDALRLAFVEPIEDKAPGFWKHAAKLPVSRERVSLVAAAMDGSCREPETKLYRVSRQAGRDFDFEEGRPNGWVSVNPRHPITTVCIWADNNMPVRCRNHTGQCIENFQRFRHAPNLTDYLEAVAIPCRTPAGLLEDLGASVEDLAMLVVDAEDLDAQIVLSLVSRSDFRPGFIMWEAGGALEAQLSNELRKKGYHVGMKAGMDGGHSDADASNIVAVLP